MRTEIYASITYNELKNLRKLVDSLESKMSINESAMITVVCASEGMENVDKDVLIGIQSGDDEFYFNIEHRECNLLASTLKCFYDVNRDFLIHKQ